MPHNTNSELQSILQQKVRELLNQNPDLINRIKSNFPDSAKFVGGQNQQQIPTTPVQPDASAVVQDQQQQEPIQNISPSISEPEIQPDVSPFGILGISGSKFVQDTVQQVQQQKLSEEQQLAQIYQQNKNNPLLIASRRLEEAGQFTDAFANFARRLYIATMEGLGSVIRFAKLGSPIANVRAQAIAEAAALQTEIPDIRESDASELTKAIKGSLAYVFDSEIGPFREELLEQKIKTGIAAFAAPGAIGSVSGVITAELLKLIGTYGITRAVLTPMIETAVARSMPTVAKILDSPRLALPNAQIKDLWASLIQNAMVRGAEGTAFSLVYDASSGRIPNAETAFLFSSVDILLGGTVRHIRNLRNAYAGLAVDPVLVTGIENVNYSNLIEYAFKQPASKVNDMLHNAGIYTDNIFELSIEELRKANLFSDSAYQRAFEEFNFAKNIDEVEIGKFAKFWAIVNSPAFKYGRSHIKDFADNIAELYNMDKDGILESLSNYRRMKSVSPITGYTDESFFFDVAKKRGVTKRMIENMNIVKQRVLNDFMNGMVYAGAKSRGDDYINLLAKAFERRVRLTSAAFGISNIDLGAYSARELDDLLDINTIRFENSIIRQQKISKDYLDRYTNDPFSLIEALAIEYVYKNGVPKTANDIVKFIDEVRKFDKEL